MTKIKKVIAIDFDGTITEDSPYPIMGMIREDAKIYIQKLYEKGYTLILWTCRSGCYLQEAESVLKLADIYKYFDYIDSTKIPYPSRKIVADFYIDNRALMEPVNWKKIYNYIINNV